QGSEEPYAPTAELARTHLVHAVRYVLALPPVQGRAAAAHVIAQITSEYFPTEIAAAKAQLQAAGLDRPKDVLVTHVFDQLVIGFFEGSGGTAALKAQRRVLSAINAVQEMFPGVTEPRLRHHLNRIIGRLNDSDKRLYVPFVRRIVVSWDLLEQVYRD